MIAPTSLRLSRILILKADRLYAEGLRKEAAGVFPAAQFTLVNRLKSAAAQLASGAFDLLVTGVGFPDGDVLDLLAERGGDPRSARRVLVVTSRRDQRLLATLRSLGVEGVFDSASEGAEQLRHALRQVGSDATYWSDSLIECLIHQAGGAESVEKLLTATEQKIFAVLGDGCDDESAAARLGLKASTVLSVRRELHRKLRVQHRGELVRLAAQYGYVRFTPTAVVRPGFSLLMAERRGTSNSAPGES